MIFSDARCNECSFIFQVEKQNIMDEFVVPACPKCGSKDTYRKFGYGTHSICQGAVGRAANGYENTIAGYHPSELGVYKGKRIR